MDNNLLIKIWMGTLLLLLVFILYPKDAGYTCGFCAGPPNILRTEFDCTGFTFEYQPTNCIDCGKKIKCVGIVSNTKTCFTYDENGGLIVVEGCVNSI